MDDHGPSARSDRLCGRILLAEDAAIIHKLVSRFLHVAGAEVTVVEDGAEALRAAVETPFDLILMDVEMPEMSGVEVTAALRARGIQTPIVALTAHDPRHIEQEAAHVGLTDVLAKPIDRQTLVDKCAAFLSRQLTPSPS